MVANKRLSLLITTSTLGLSLIFCLSGCQTIKIGGKANPDRPSNQLSNADERNHGRLVLKCSVVDECSYQFAAIWQFLSGYWHRRQRQSKFYHRCRGFKRQSSRFHKRLSRRRKPQFAPYCSALRFDGEYARIQRSLYIR